MLGAGAANEAQKRLFNLIMGDTGNQKVDEFGKPMVDPVTGKPVYENSFDETAGMMSEAGAYNVPGQLLAAALPNLIAGNPQLPALFNVGKIRQIVKLASEARAGTTAAVKALQSMGIDDAAIRMAEQLAPKLTKPTGLMARAAAVADSPTGVAFKNASQWLGEASGVAKAFGPRAEQMKIVAAAIKSHPELSHFASELVESAAETGTEVQQAIQQRQEIKDYNEKARAAGLPEQEQNSLLQDMANVLIGISFEGENRLSSLGYRAGSNVSNRVAQGLGYDTNPITRAIANEIKGTGISTRISTLAPDEHLVGVGKGEFAIVNTKTKTSRIIPAEEVDPAMFGVRTGSTPLSGQGERMAAAADIFVPKAGFGKVPEFKPIGANKEIVQGITTDGYVIRRQLSADNKADVRVVSLDQLAPENQTIANQFFQKAGMKPSEVTGFTETHTYTNQHHMGLMERQLQGQSAEAFHEAFPAQIALDNNINVFGRIVKLVGKQHAAVQIPTEGRGTDLVVVPLQNIVEGTHAAKAPLNDAEVDEIAKRSEYESDQTSHNPLGRDTDRITDASLDGGRNPVMLTPEQVAAVKAKRDAINSARDMNLSKGMAAEVAKKKRDSQVGSNKKGFVKDIAKDSPAYPVGSYIEHTDSKGATVGGVVIDNTAHGPLIRPLNNGAPYVAQHTTITSGDPVAPEISPAITDATTSTPAEDATTVEDPTVVEEPIVDDKPIEPTRRRREFKRGAVEVGVDKTGKAEEEITSPSEPTDVEATGTPVGSIQVDGTMVVSEAEGKAIAAISAELTNPSTGKKTIADIIAQKPRNREELEDALTDFLIGTPYQGKPMTDVTARKAASALANIYDRMIFGQATRILQMTQDAIGGHPDSRVANPISKKSEEKKKELDYRKHHPRDYPLINHTVDLLDEAARSLAGETLTWKDLSTSNDKEQRAIAVRAVAAVRKKLIDNYYESSVPAIGKFDKLSDISASGLYAAVKNKDGQIAGRMLIGFASRDVSTAVHEVAHALFEGMPADMQLDVLKHMGMTDREGTKVNPSIIPYEAHEKFATSFEASILNAEHDILGIKLGGNRVNPVKYLDGLFTELAPYLRDVYGVVYGETEKPAASLTWMMPYRGNESSIFLWDNMPVIVKIDGQDVRCKIPLAEKWWLHHQGPGVLKADSTKQFKVEVVEFDHPLKGQLRTITNKSIVAIGGVTNGFNKRFASAMTYWLSERANRANAERNYVGLTGYGKSPAELSTAKAISKGTKVVTATPGTAIESGVEPTPTPEPGTESTATPESITTSQVILPAPQMADKTTYVARVLPDIMTRGGTEKLVPAQVAQILETVYDINRQNSSVARDKWRDYDFYAQKTMGGDKHIEVKRKSDGLVFRVNMATGDVLAQDSKKVWQSLPIEKVYARPAASAPKPEQTQDRIDAVWEMAKAPENIKPKVKGFMYYIAQLHGQDKGFAMPEWLPVKRSEDAPQTIQEANEYLSSTQAVNDNSVTFETIPTVRGDMKVLEYEGRLMVVANINGVKIPFYVSTGEAGKVTVQPGRWYPVFGIGPDGWINKGTSAGIVSHYGSPVLKAVAEHLDYTLGNLRDVRVKSVPMEVDSPEFNFINDGMIGSGKYVDEPKFNAQLQQIVNAVETSKDVIKKKAEAIKKKQKKQPSPIIKAEPEGMDVLKAVGMKDFTQADLDSIGRELLPDQYELVNNPDTPPAHKEALLRLGYAKKIGAILTASSKDKEVAQGDQKNSNARQARQQAVTFADEVMVRSRQQVAIAEALDSNGRIKALSEFEKISEPTDAIPVISLRNKKDKLVYNVNLKTGETTITLPDGTINNQKGSGFLDSNGFKFIAPNWMGTVTEYVGTVAANMNMASRAQQISKRQGIPVEKMPQVYSGMLHIARMFAAIQTTNGLTVPAVPSTVLWKMNGTTAFNEAKSVSLFQLRQQDRNKAVGEPILTPDIKHIPDATAEAIKKQDHDNHSMQLIDRSGIMRVKSEDEPTSAQEFRAMVINQKVEQLKVNTQKVLESLKDAMKKKGMPVPDNGQPYVYRIIEPSPYIDENTGGFAIAYERDETGELATDENGEVIPILDKDGKPKQDLRPVEKFVLSYAKMPVETDTVDMSKLTVYREDGSRVTDDQPYTGMERAKKSGERYVFYNPISPSPDGNGSTQDAQNKALNFIINSYQTLAARMLQKYTPIVKWDNNPIAGMQVWARSIPDIKVKTPSMNGVPVASVVIGAAKMAYNIDAVGATNRWQSKEITRYDNGIAPVTDLELTNAVETGDKHYFAIESAGNKFIYKMTATNITTKQVGVFTSEKAYTTEDEAKKAAQQEYLVLRGQAYDIWHKIGAQRIASDVVKLGELSTKDITADMTDAERKEIMNAQVIMRQFDWYRGVSKKIMRRYGPAGLAMADLIGGTSPQTPVDANWTNAVQALQIMNRTATYERVVRKGSGDKVYYKVPFNTERSVQVYSIWKNIKNKANFLRGANVDGSNTSEAQQEAQRSQRAVEYASYMKGNSVDVKAIKSATDEDLKRLLGDEIVSKLETKIPEEYKRKQLEDVATSLVRSTVWTSGGSDPVASFTGWAQATDDWLPSTYTSVTPKANAEPVEQVHTNQTEKMDFTVLPRNVFSGNKFGANTDNVLQGFFNTWLDIDSEGSAPKARNFSLNLVGLSSGATIDVWAARYVRRMYHEWHQSTADFASLPDEEKTFFARVPPSAEPGVEGGYLGKSHYSVEFNADGEAKYVPAKYQRPNPAEPTTGGEFGTGQAVMGLATDYINQATGGKLEMLPSDLQAIVWFAEKQLWMNNGWTNASGAGGSFEYQFAQDVLRYGELERFNVMMSGNGVRHLTPEQKTRLMQIMRKTLWVDGKTTEGSPIAHLSALVSNSNGNQLNPGGQTQVDINLVAKRGSTPLKPYDPEVDVHALVLNKSPEEIRDILAGRKDLSLPNNLLNEHANRRISLAVMNGGELNIVGSAVFGGGQTLGEGGQTIYKLVPSNELTDSRSVILPADKSAAVHNLPDAVDYNQLVHIKPAMWKGRAKQVNGTSPTALYPARVDTGKHRRIREHQAYNVNELKNASADMLRITGGLDAVISRVVGEHDGQDDITFTPESNLRIGHEVYFKPALADERVDQHVKDMYNERFSNMMRRMETYFDEHNAHIQFVVQQDPRNQYSAASLVNGNVGILAVWNPETEMRYMDYGAGVPENLMTPEQKANNAKLMDYMSGDLNKIRKHEEEWNETFKDFWEQESSRPDSETIPIFQNFANHYDVNTIHREALTSETAPTTGIDDQSTAWGLGIREKLRHSIQQLGIGIGDGRVILEANTQHGEFNEILAGTREAQLQSEAPIKVGLYQTRKSDDQKEFHVHCTSYAGSRLPGFNGVYDYAMDSLIRGNQADYEKAMDRLSTRASQEIERVFEGMDGVEIKTDRNTGIFFGDVEPSIDATITMDSDKYSIDDVLARAAHMGLMFRQQNVYVTQDAAKNEIAGQPYDGYTVEYRATFNLDKPITFGMMKDIQSALNLGGANLSQDGKTLTTFTVSTEGDSHAETVEQWFKGVGQINSFLQTSGVSATFTEDSCRLWNTGSTEDGAYGKFTPYGEVLDNLRRGNPKALVKPVTTAQYNRNVEEVKADVEFAMSMLRGRDIKLPDSMSFARTPLSVETQMAIADNYDNLPSNAVSEGPDNDPMAVKAYQALVKELDKQWKWLNVKIDFMPSYKDESGEMVYVDSYNANSAEVIADIRNNNHLYIYPTSPDTFGQKGEDYSGHPLLQMSPHKTADGKPLMWNDVLRAVHDALAHSIYGASFGANGEELAFATHALLTEDPMAIWALNSETRAQNSWVNFNKSFRNPDGSMMKKLPFLRDRPFAPQKAALMPIDTLYTGIKVIDQRIDTLREDMVKNHNSYGGSIPDVDVIPTPLTDGFSTKGVAMFQTRTPDKNESPVPSRPVYSWHLKRKGTVPMPAPAPPTPTVPQPQSVSERIWAGYDTFNDFCRLSVGGDASPMLIQNFLLANPIEDPKLFFQQFLIMTRAARPNLSLSWKGKVIVDGKNFGRQADVDLGNELRGSAFYGDAKAHGLSLSAFTKDEALLELQKTNPKATLMDINELGYNQDVSVSNEIMQHLPGQGASERFFSMSKDYVKMNKYAQAAQHLVDVGYIQGTPGYEEAARDLANIINVASGDIKFASQDDADNAFGRVAKRLFFAPRWATSRFAIDPLGRAILQGTPWGRDILKRNGLDKWEDRDPYTKALHYRILAKTYAMWAGLAALYGLLYGNGAIKTSITKGGMQLQIGDFKFKPPAGIDKTMAIITSVASIFESNDKKSNQEKLMKVFDNMKVTFMGQLAPGASALLETASGRNLFGEPSREVYTPLQRHWEDVTRPILAKAGIDVPFPKVSNMVADKFIYMWAQDMMESYEAMADRDEPYPLLQSTAIAAAAFMGGRVRYAPKELNWKYDAAKNREAPGIEHTFIGADKAGSVDMQWDKLTR